MQALRRKPAAKTRQGDYGRRATPASGDRSAAREGAYHRVSVSGGSLWTVRKNDACAAARRDRGTIWTATDGVGSLLDGSLPLAATVSRSDAGRCVRHRDQFGKYPESLGRSQPGG